ncbi:MAG: D-glycero-beta-D-manno-heptose 1-phosphate adenylyltransferase [Chloroflexi bacterium]|nr:D-glycero-beta-D-manno-heptose 1-phosphate adenylyltransferase [Chloroflexota bacterium]
MGNLVSLEQVLDLRRQWRADGRKVVLTNGCFDLIHAGHVRHLQAARALGDLLVVALNSDASVRRIKGPKRPIVPSDERAEILLALRAVDSMLLFDDDTAEPIVAAVQPDVYVKGADYAPESGKPLPEAAVVAGYGGRVALIPLVEGRSTTNVIATVRERYGRTDEPLHRQTGGIRSMITQIATVTMYVRDQDEVLKFYTEKLGFEKREDATFGPGFRWLTIAPPGGQTELVLLKPDPNVLGPELARRAEAEIGFAPHLVLWADDVEATYRALSARGVEFVESPAVQPWGGVMAQFRDLYGNVIVLHSPRD